MLKLLCDFTDPGDKSQTDRPAVNHLSLKDQVRTICVLVKNHTCPWALLLLLKGVMLLSVLAK